MYLSRSSVDADLRVKIQDREFKSVRERVIGMLTKPKDKKRKPEPAAQSNARKEPHRAKPGVSEAAQVKDTKARQVRREDPDVRAGEQVDDTKNRKSARSKNAVDRGASWRVFMSQRKNETAEDRKVRRVRESKTTHSTKDARLRSEAGRRIAALQLQDRPDWMAGQRSRPKLDPPPPLDAHTRLSEYFDVLGNMPSRIHKCPNCLQKGIDHSISATLSAAEARTAKCWFCERNPNVLHWSNGLDLNLDPLGPSDAAATNADRQSNVPQAARQEWKDLNAWLAGGWETDESPEGVTLKQAVEAEPRFAWVTELTPIEEALISRVSCCASVLSLPCDDQLGYRGNVINFVNDLGRCIGSSLATLRSPALRSSTGSTVKRRALRRARW